MDEYKTDIKKEKIQEIIRLIEENCAEIRDIGRLIKFKIFP